MTETTTLTEAQSFVNHVSDTVTDENAAETEIGAENTVTADETVDAPTENTSAADNVSAEDMSVDENTLSDEHTSTAPANTNDEAERETNDQADAENHVVTSDQLNNDHSENTNNNQELPKVNSGLSHSESDDNKETINTTHSEKESATSDKFESENSEEKASEDKGNELVKEAVNTATRASFFANGTSLRAVQTGRNVNSLVNISDFDIKYVGGGSSQNEAWITSSGHPELHFNYRVDDSVQAGDYFTVNFGDYVVPGLLNTPRKPGNLNSAQGVPIAISSYNEATNSAVFTFTEYVDAYRNVRGTYAESLWPQRDKVTDNKQTVPVNVQVAGQSFSKPITFDYGNKKQNLISSITNIDNQAGTISTTTYVNQSLNNTGYHSVTIDGKNLDFKNPATSIKVYKVPRSVKLNDSFVPNLSQPGITEVKNAVTFPNGQNSARVSLGNINNYQYVILTTTPLAKSANEETSFSATLVKNNTTNVAGHSSSLNARDVSSTGTGDIVEETNGKFQEHHRYETVDEQGNVISVDDEVSGDLQEGTVDEVYLTGAKNREGYTFTRTENAKNDPYYSPSGAVTAGVFKDGVTQEITYVYQRVVPKDTPSEPPVETKDNELYEMIEEDSSYKTEFKFDPSLKPGEIKELQTGQDRRVKVLYKHINPETIPNFDPSQFVSFRGQYWQEVSREVIQEERPQIFGYNIEQIVETRNNEDGGVTIVYNTGREIVIPGKTPTADPVLPKEPIVEVERTVGIHPDTGQEVSGSKVTVKIYNPNTDKFESEKVTFIPDGQNGRDGVDGKSPKAEVKDNGDGTHTVTITNPDGTTSETIIRNGQDGKDGAKGEKGDKGDKGDKGEDGRDGVDGKSSYVKTEPGQQDGRDGHWIITYFDKNGD
ncbi:fibrinogen-binding adhesin SdrG C-terminal domain-containing protein, partial [Aerococcus sp. YH-aer221]|uniref:collagen-flanked surface repeat-containing protein n=1 Tax=Aerococcus kribbianus TaxID=2999064 RepID=UPI002286B6FA